MVVVIVVAGCGGEVEGEGDALLLVYPNLLVLCTYMHASMYVPLQTSMLFHTNEIFSTCRDLVPGRYVMGFQPCVEDMNHMGATAAAVLGK